jgi:hypothetical protein
MPNVDNTTILIIVGALVILVALLMMGTRLRRFIFRAGGIDATADAGTPGARVIGTKIKGSFDSVTAKGDNALVKDTDIEGHGNTVTSDTESGKK